MDNLELSEWVRARVALLDPPADWEPSAAVARGRFAGRRLRQSRFRRHLLLAAAAVVIVGAVIPAIPVTRVLAQPAGGGDWFGLDSVWYWFLIVHQPGSIVNLRVVPEAVKTLRAQALAGLAGAAAVPDVAEASRRVGFNARLPHGVTGPRVSVLDAASFNLDVRTTDLEAAARKNGVHDLDVPGSWDGARIGLRLGAAAIAAWQGHDEWDRFTLAQSPLPAITAPAGFDVERFAAATLRAGRMGRQNALRFASVPIIAAAVLLTGDTGDATQPFMLVRRVELRAGPGTVIEIGEPYQGSFGIRRLSLVWTTADRVYALTGVLGALVRFDSGDVARAWTELTDIANTVK